MEMLSNRREVEIEWGDCDAAGIVFYPRYFEMFDASTGRLFEKAFGMKKVDWAKKHAIPSAYGDVVTIESRVTAIGRSSIEIAHTVFKGDRVAIEAHEKRVWTGRDPDEPARLKSVAISDDVRALLTGT
jgi:4-hydroxybenzoyl-CoA thioesterase